jgi:SOS-response transcriptional repressor LexA
MIDKLKSLIEQSGETQTDIAKKMGVTHASLNHLLTGRRKLSDDKFYDILVKAFNYTHQEAVEQIAKWRMETLAEEAGIKIPDGAIPMADNYEYVPLVSEVSCGEGMEIEAIMNNKEHEALVPVPKEYIKDLDKTFAFTAKGNSMSNEIQDGDTVVIQQTKSYTPGKVYLYKLGEDFGLARLKREPDGNVTIQKANPQYPPVQVGGNDIEVCGVVQVVLNLRVY